MKPPVQAQRWRLRPLDAADAGLYSRLYGNARTMRFIGPALSPRECRHSLNEVLRQMRSPRGPRLFTIVDAGDRAQGICALQPLARRQRCIELGIMLCAGARGRGIAHESAKALISAAFETLPIDAVWVQYHPANAAAERLFAGLRFRSAAVPRRRGARRGFTVVFVAKPAWCVPQSSHPGGKSMSSIIEFLESMGRDAGLRHASTDQLQRAMRHADVAPHLRAALLDADAQRIESMIGARERIYCATFPVRVPKKAPAKTPKKPVKAPPKPAKRPAKAPAKSRRGSAKTK